MSRTKTITKAESSVSINKETKQTLSSPNSVSSSSSLGKRRRLRNKIRGIIKKESFFDFRFIDVPESEPSRFWTSPLFVIQYVIVAIALVSQQLWVLQGILLIIIAFIAHVVYQWIRYIIRDPKLQKCMVSFRWYFSFACRQAEATMEGGNSRRMVEAGFLAYQRAATNVLEWFLRQRLENVNRVMIKQHENNIARWEQWKKEMHQSMTRSNNK